MPENWQKYATVLKILIGYLQMLSVFGRINTVAWPPIFQGFLNLLDQLLNDFLRVTAFVSELLMPFDCIYDDVNAYDWLWMTFILPLICSVVIIFVACLAVSVARPVKQCGYYFSSLGPALWNIHIWLGLLLYPSISREMLSQFICTNVHGVRYLSSDTSLDTILQSGAGVFLRRGLSFTLLVPLCCFLDAKVPIHEREPSDETEPDEVEKSRRHLGRRISLSWYLEEHGWWFERPTF